MWRFGGWLRFRRLNVIVALVTFVTGLGFIWATAEPNIYMGGVGLAAVAPEDHNEETMRAHAQRAVSDRAIEAVRAKLWPPAPGREPRDRGAWSGVSSVEDGTFHVVGEAEKEADALAFANTLADAYIQSQNRDRLTVRLDEEARVRGVTVRSMFGEPREIVQGVVLTLLASVLLLFAPLRWLNPVRLARRLRDRARRLTPARKLLGLALVPVVLLGLSLLGLFPWSGLNCWQNDVDINTGRVRYTRYLFWLPVNRAVRDSDLTRALPQAEITDMEADWHPVVVLSPRLHYSPHYRFHGALGQIHTLELCWKTATFTPGARRDIAQRVLDTWRQKQSYFSTADYVYALSELAIEAEDQGRTIDVSDLPDWAQYEKER